MGLCVNLGYEVVTDTRTATTGTGQQEFRLTAPTGKKPVGGGLNVVWTDSPFNHKTYIVVVASYPDDDEWVFVINKDALSVDTDVDLYMTCINT